MKKILTSLLAVVALMGTLCAQVPQGFNYQMVVRNTNGQLISESPVGVLLTIRQGTPVGTVVYQLNANPVTNTNGLVTLVVGSGSDAASYAAIDWANGPYFLVCEVDPNGGNNYALRTEQQILSVPYASYATTADHVSQSFTYDEQDPHFAAWNYNYDSLMGAPTALSQFTNDLDLFDASDLQLHLTGNVLDINGVSSVTLPQTTSLPWDSVTSHPTHLSQFTNDLTLFDASDLQLNLTGNVLDINGVSSVTLPQTTSLPWDSVTSHPTHLSQFTNDLTLFDASDLQLNLTGNVLDINGVSSVTLPQTTSLPWDSITSHPTSLSQFTNDLTLFDASDLQLNLTGNVLDINGVSSVTLPQTTSLPWDSITSHPTSLSQFDNDLSLQISGDTLFIGTEWILMPGNSGFVVEWDNIVNRPTNVSAFFNDRGYLTTESQNLTEVLAMGNDANNNRIVNLGLPTSSGDAANKQYVDNAMAAERIALNNRIDSLRLVVSGLHQSIDSLRSANDSLRIQNQQVSTDLFNYQHRLIEGELAGVFSVSDSDYVRFSCGNLQYRVRTGTWRFAPTQSAFVGTDNNNISNLYYAGWIDLFGYGTSGWDGGSITHGSPTSTSTNDGEYTESTDGDDLIDMYKNADWGYYNHIINGGNQTGLWRTLTFSEWTYVISDRSRATQLRGLATVGSSQGLVLLPDDWTLPAGSTFTAGVNDYTSNVYNADQWRVMENAGAVFLPSAGCRTASTTTQDNVEGHYWSTTHVNGYMANSIKIANVSGASQLNANCSNGYSVRLVRDY